MSWFQRDREDLFVALALSLAPQKVAAKVTPPFDGVVVPPLPLPDLL